MGVAKVESQKHEDILTAGKFNELSIKGTDHNCLIVTIALLRFSNCCTIACRDSHGWHLSANTDL